jgi:hypothetical protein
MGMILDGIELPVCCGEGFRIYPYNGDVIITCDGTPKFAGTNIPYHNKCNKSKTLNNLKDGILWEDCGYCGGDLYEETMKSVKDGPEDFIVCEGCFEKHYDNFEAESKKTEDDDDYLPDFLKEDSVVESPFGLDDMVMPSDYEWPYLIDDFSVENILKLNKEGKNPNNTLTGIQWRALGKIKDNLYNWDNEPGFSDIFHKEFCKKYDISLSVLKTLEKKGLIKLSKDDYYFKERGYIVYPKPLMYLVYISEQDYPDWFIPEAKEKGLWKAESFEAKGYAPDKPFYATTHENGYTTVMHPIKCGHYKMVMNGTGVWDSPTFYDTIEEMFTTEFDNIMDSQYGGMVEWAMSDPDGKEAIRKYKDIKTIGDARKFAKRYFDFKIDFAPCFRKERNYDSKALNALPITVYPFWIDEWADEYSDALREFQAETKKINPIEKAGISGVASGATMEGLETLMAAEEDEGEELSHEQLRAYFARLKDKNPKLAKEIEISIKDQSYLPPHSVINKAGFDYEIIEAWADLVAEEDKYAPFERCDECEGEGYILTSYTSATRFDPADGDGEDCGECGGTGEIDPADYMYSNHDGRVHYLAETFESRDTSWCVNHGWIQGSKIGDIIPCSNCDNMNCGGCRCGGCGNCENSDCCECKNAESFEAAEWVGFCPECNKWRTKDMSVKIDSKINTTGWSIPDKLLGKRLCKKSQRFGKIRQSGDTFTGYGSRSFDNSYCGTPLTKVKSKYKAEAEETKSMNPYLLGAGIFALTLGILSRKL